MRHNFQLVILSHTVSDLCHSRVSIAFQLSTKHISAATFPKAATTSTENRVMHQFNPGIHDFRSVAMQWLSNHRTAAAAASGIGEQLTERGGLWLCREGNATAQVSSSSSSLSPQSSHEVDCHKHQDKPKAGWFPLQRDREVCHQHCPKSCPSALPGPMPVTLIHTHTRRIYPNPPPPKLCNLLATIIRPRRVGLLKPSNQLCLVWRSRGREGGVVTA